MGKNQKRSKIWLKNEEKIEKELEIIKKLLILHILKSGATPNEIRNILKMSGEKIRELIPIKNMKTYKKDQA